MDAAGANGRGANADGARGMGHKGCQCRLRGGCGANAGAQCERGHRWPQGCGGWSKGHRSPHMREIGMHVLQGWVRNVSAGVGEWVSICFIIHSFVGEGAGLTS